MGKLSLAAVGVLWLAACDPKTPVQTSDIDTQTDQKIAAHNADSSAHPGLPIHVNQLQETIGSAQITDLSITSADIQDGAITGTQLGNGAVGPQALAANAVQTAAIGDLMVTNAKIADTTITSAKISATAGITGSQLAAGANITGSQLSATANIAGSQLAAAANIAGTQLAAAANITGTQLSATANITGTQLSATANIAGTQLAAAANIAGTQLANATITGTKIASGTIADDNLKTFQNGRETDNAAFQDFYSMKASATTAQFYFVFACGAEGATAGTIQLEDNNAIIGTNSVTCPANGAPTPEFFRLPTSGTINPTNNHVYTLSAKAGAANSPVAWRGAIMMAP